MLLSAPLPGSVVTDYIAVTTAHRHMYWAVPSAHLHAVVAAHVNLGARLVPSVREDGTGHDLAAEPGRLVVDHIEPGHAPLGPKYLRLGRA